jgi:hypothetical protein
MPQTHTTEIDHENETLSVDHYLKTVNMSTYLLAIAVGEFVSTSMLTHGNVTV